jgi:exosortase/archaeosortase family protein
VALRAVAATSVAAFGAATLTIWAVPYRDLEARAASALVNPFTPTRLYQNEWHVNHGGVGTWFVVTFLCTSSVLLIPILLVGAWAATMPLVRLRSALAGMVTGIGVVVTLNTLRLAVIALSWSRWGDPSLWVTHDLIGTLVSLIAMTAGVGTQVIMTGATARAETRQFDGVGAGP